MNKQMFEDKIAKIGAAKLMIQAIRTEDDIGAVLRIHLLCEQLSEAWICAACNADNFFGEGNYSVKINCSDKFKLARNLGIPDTLCSGLKMINAIRNNLAHGSGHNLISDESIDKLVNLLKGFQLENQSNKWGIDVPILVNSQDGLTSYEYSIYDKNTPNRIKLYICFSFLMSRVLFFLGIEKIQF
ncbi:hypothetical protein CO695_13110 [Providencia alcalifaciens]|nr:hypothetical protein [Providencia alcalifaciens]ATG17188.1 hypothetical protein CO695_13110 [Providencia alcalifaciens]SQI37961.1 Uncharacterised protein [Providencia alcalifaciens]